MRFMFWTPNRSPKRPWCSMPMFIREETERGHRTMFFFFSESQIEPHDDHAEMKQFVSTEGWIVQMSRTDHKYSSQVLHADVDLYPWYHEQSAWSPTVENIWQTTPQSHDLSEWHSVLNHPRIIVAPKKQLRNSGQTSHWLTLVGFFLALLYTQHFNNISLTVK